MGNHRLNIFKVLKDHPVLMLKRIYLWQLCEISIIFNDNDIINIPVFKIYKRTVESESKSFFIPLYKIFFSVEGNIRRERLHENTDF